MKRNLSTFYKSLATRDDKTIVCGLDEAGRGPVLGPMMICGVCFYGHDLQYLEEIGVKDSKKLSSNRRKELSHLIKEKCVSYELIEVSAQEIDQRVEQRTTLNKLEVNVMASIINKLQADYIFIDAADVSEDRFKNLILIELDYEPKQVIPKHKGDDLFTIVSAASIVAKEARDNQITLLRKKYLDLGYEDLGSGYASDKKTINFLRTWIKKHKKAPNFARLTWETTRKILNEEVYNRKITDFFK